MAKEEVARLEAEEKRLGSEVQRGILPPDPTDSRNTIIEIRAGAGGSESALFAADLYRMYTRYAEARGWKVEDAGFEPVGSGRVQGSIFSVTGTDVYKRLKYESGVHRVQRVPATEAQGRIHTSTATVAVLPEAEEVDIEIKPEDLEITVCRASGQGGQGVNTTDSAVQIHPQAERVDRALRGSTFPAKEQGARHDRAAFALARTKDRGRKRQICRPTQSPGRHRRTQRTHPHLQLSAKPVTDHRIELTLYNLPTFIEGDIDPIIEPLMANDLEEKTGGAEILSVIHALRS